MTFPFSNQIVGPDGVLVRPAIRSPNYVPGVSGWAIFKDGTAEFNDADIRGDLSVGVPLAATITADVPAEILARYAMFDIPIKAIKALYPQDGGYNYEVVGMFDPTTELWATGFVGSDGHANEFINVLWDTAITSGQLNFGAGPDPIVTQWLGGSIDLASNFVPLTAYEISDPNGIPYRPTQCDVFPVNLSGVTSQSFPISFPVPFPDSGPIPTVTCSINGGGGNTARWGARPITITRAGFSLFVFSGDNPPTAPGTPWVNVPVSWQASTKQ